MRRETDRKSWGKTLPQGHAPSDLLPPGRPRHLQFQEPQLGTEQLSHKPMGMFPTVLHLIQKGMVTGCFLLTNMPPVYQALCAGLLHACTTGP